MQVSAEIVALIATVAGVGVALVVALVSGFAWMIRRMDGLRDELGQRNDSLRDELGQRIDSLRDELVQRIGVVEREIVDVKVSLARIEGTPVRLLPAR